MFSLVPTLPQQRNQSQSSGQKKFLKALLFLFFRSNVVSPSSIFFLPRDRLDCHFLSSSSCFLLTRWLTSPAVACLLQSTRPFSTSPPPGSSRRVALCEACSEKSTFSTSYSAARIKAVLHHELRPASLPPWPYHSKYLKKKNKVPSVISQIMNPHQCPHLNYQDL